MDSCFWSITSSLMNRPKGLANMPRQICIIMMIIITVRAPLITYTLRSTRAAWICRRRYLIESDSDPTCPNVERAIRSSTRAHALIACIGLSANGMTFFRSSAVQVTRHSFIHHSIFNYNFHKFSIQSVNIKHKAASLLLLAASSYNCN